MNLHRLGPRESGPGRNTTAALLAGLIAVSGTIFILVTIHRFRNVPFAWDCGARACEGLRIARDVKAGDFVSFVGDTYSQGWWGFFHSWLIAPGILVFGATYEAARLISLICFVLLIPTIFLLACEFSPERGPWIGLLTVFLMLTSLPFLVFSAMAMAEMPGALMTFLTFLVYVRARKRESGRLFVLAGILLAATLFTAWHHGVFAIFAVVVTQLTTEKKILSRSNRFLFLPFLIIMLGWFAYPRHILSFYGHSTFQPQYYSLLSLDNLLYYPRYIIGLYHSSLVVGILMAAGFLYSLRRIKEPTVRLLAAQFFMGLVLMTLKLDNRPRYIISIVPSMWILAWGAILEGAARLRGALKNKTLRRVLIACAAVGLVAVSAPAAVRLYRLYPDLLVRLNYSSTEKLNPVYDFIAENSAAHNRFAVFGSWDYLQSPNSPTIRWHIEVRRSRDRESILKKKKEASLFLGELIKRRNGESYRNFIGFLESKDVRVDEYHLLSFMRILDPDGYEEFRRKTDLNPFSDKIVDARGLDPRVDCLVVIYNAEETHLNSFAERFLSEHKEWGETKSRRFEDLGLSITIYERRSAAAAS